jgi:endonuclease VIII
VPEGDTLFRIQAALAPVLIGKRAHVTLPQRSVECEPVVIDRVHVHGKNLFVVFLDGRALYTHLRMRGKWHVYKAYEPWRKARSKATVMLETEAHVAVCFEVPSAAILSPLQARRFMATFVDTSDILKDTFDVEGAAARLQRQAKTAVAIALLDQSVLAGIGNVYKSEVLFACKIHPEDLCDALSAPDAQLLIATAQRMMRLNVQTIARGTPGAHYAYQRTTRTTAAGCEVGKGAIAVYGRVGRDCYTCGETIAMIRQGPLLRSSYFCPSCQKRNGS